MTGSSGLLGLAVAGGTSAAASHAIWRGRHALPGLRDRPRWDRVNHRGRHVDLAAGPAFALGSAAGLLAAPGSTTAHRALGLTALLGSATFGLIDDLADDSHAKGLSGHLRSLAQGKPTTGGLKILGIGASAVTASLLGRGADARLGRHSVLGAGIIAASANLVNLLDLRPGRALKVGIAGASVWGLMPGRWGLGARGWGPRPSGTAGGSSSHVCAGAVIGPSLALWRADLAEEAMLGDCGANGLGALLGVLLLLRTAHQPTAVRARILIAMALATAVSEKVSFTAVIEATPVLRRLDAWGRAGAPAATAMAPTAPPPRTAGATAASWAEPAAR